MYYYLINKALMDVQVIGLQLVFQVKMHLLVTMNLPIRATIGA